MLIWSNIVKTVNNKLLEPFLCLQRRFTLPTGFESYELLFYSIHTWNYKLGDSLLKINKVVTKLLNVYVARKRESHLFRPSWAACLGMCPILRAEARITTESSRNKEPKPLCECVYERESPPPIQFHIKRSRLSCPHSDSFIFPHNTCTSPTIFIMYGL